MKKTWLILVVFLSACNMPGNGAAPTATNTPRPPTTTPTPTQAFTATEDPHVAELETAEAKLVNLNATITAQAEEIEKLDRQVERARARLTPKATSTSGVPGTVGFVVATQKVNLRRIKEYNKAGAPLMVISNPRVQYDIGETFQVYKGAILGDGGERFYEVYGPRGSGLYVRASDITTPK